MIRLVLVAQTQHFWLSVKLSRLKTASSLRYFSMNTISSLVVALLNYNLLNRVMRNKYLVDLRLSQ